MNVVRNKETNRFFVVADGHYSLNSARWPKGRRGGEDVNAEEYDIMEGEWELLNGEPVPADQTAFDHINRLGLASLFTRTSPEEKPSRRRSSTSRKEESPASA